MMNEQEFYTAFDGCITALQSGKTLKECLVLYPNLQEELRPALEAAQAAHSMKDETIPNSAVRRSRARMLAKAGELKRQRTRRGTGSLLGWFSASRATRLAFATLLVIMFFLISWQGLLVASAQALPGDTLYPVKRSAENFSLQIASNAQLKRAREVEFERRRLDEVLGLLALSRVANVEFEGVLNEKTPDRWIVDGVVVLVNPDTQLAGQIEPGMVVEVFGETQPDGTVRAAKIELHSYQFIGQVDSVSGSEWVISGIPVRILRSSQIDAAARLDDRVIVLVEVGEDGTLRALAILRLLQPSLVATVVPQPTSTPSPTSSPTTVSDETEIAGVIESITGNVWTVAGVSFIVTAETELKGSFSAGDAVKVHLQTAADGSWLAREIESENGIQPTDDVDDEDDIGDNDNGDDDQFDDGDDDNGNDDSDNDNGDDDDDDGNNNDNDNGDDDDDDGNNDDNDNGDDGDDGDNSNDNGDDDNGNDDGDNDNDNDDGGDDGGGNDNDSGGGDDGGDDDHDGGEGGGDDGHDD